MLSKCSCVNCAVQRWNQRAHFTRMSSACWLPVQAYMSYSPIMLRWMVQCGAHTVLPRASQSRYFSGIGPAHSPPFSCWQRATSDTIKSALPLISRSPVSATMWAAADSQWPRNSPADLAGGRLPAPVGVLRHAVRPPQPRLHVVVLEQVGRFQRQHVLPVQIRPVPEQARQQPGLPQRQAAKRGIDAPPRRHLFADFRARAAPRH